MLSFNEFGLSDTLLQALARMKYSVPTSIQQEAIPAIRAGRDLIASAQTGTGKTGAYGIPLFARLMGNPASQGLILAPTRELAAQIADVMRQLASGNKNLGVALIIGGDRYDRQRRDLHNSARIIVATPGRLVDHLRTQPKLLNKVDFLVLDEADRMLDMGFAPALEVIRKGLPERRQNLLFSATFPNDILKLSQAWLSEPQRIAIGATTTPAPKIEQAVLQVAGNEKGKTLLAELNKRSGSVLVFARTKRRTDRLVEFLQENGLTAGRIHGDRSQFQRQKALSGFKRGNPRVLVATDIAARGIDVPNIEHVINFDLPFAAEDYLHRIGRTGRAGKSGQALCLVAPEERGMWRSIQRYVNGDVGASSNSSRPNHNRSAHRGGNGFRKNHQQDSRRKFGQGDNDSASNRRGQRRFRSRSQGGQSRNFGSSSAANSARGNRQYSSSR